MAIPPVWVIRKRFRGHGAFSLRSIVTPGPDQPAIAQARVFGDMPRLHSCNTLVAA